MCGPTVSGPRKIRAEGCISCLVVTSGGKLSRGEASVMILDKALAKTGKYPMGERPVVEFAPRECLGHQIGGPVGQLILRVGGRRP